MAKLYNKSVFKFDLKLFLIIFIAYNSLSHTNAVINDVLTVLNMTKVVVSAISDTWDHIEKTNLGQKVESFALKIQAKGIFRRISEVSRKIEQNQDMFSTYTEYTIEQMHDYIKQYFKLELQLHEIKDIINRIDNRLNEMERYEKHQDSLEPETLIKFSEWNVSPNAFAINNLLERLHSLFVGSKRKSRTNTSSVLKMLSSSLLKSPEQLCDTNQSAQQFLHSFYSDIAYAELKGYTVMQFSWMMLRIFGKGNFTQESNLMHNVFINRIDRTEEVLREVMKRADRSVWQCDPNKHIKGQTYEEVTRLLQGYIENEIDLNEDGTCRETCEYYQNTENYGCKENKYCTSEPRCTGKITNCEYIDARAWICPASSNSSRRYDYIEYENGRILGKKSAECINNITRVKSWSSWVWLCSYCFCLCDDPGLNSDRYFNLRPTETDIKRNMVLTGLRFVKVKRIFHLQIQQGELLPGGNINPESLEWKPVDDYELHDRNVNSKIDYHSLAWDNRAIDLDDIIGDSAHVVTGVKFNVIGTHLNLEVKFSEYDFKTGKLNDPETNSFWKSNGDTIITEEKRIQIIPTKPDIPIKSIDWKLRSLPKSKHNQYIEFVNTDIDKDAAQTTIPFIDIQSVTPKPPVALSGVGIYYKGRNQYGGFIAPKLITYDFTPYIQTPFILDDEPKLF